MDRETLQTASIVRNEIVHELGQIIGGSIQIDFENIFPKLIDLLIKIDRWWIINIEFETDPDMIGKDIDEDGVVPGSILMLQMLGRVALEEDEKAWKLHRMFVEHVNGKKSGE